MSFTAGRLPRTNAFSIFVWREWRLEILAALMSISSWLQMRAWCSDGEGKFAEHSLVREVTRSLLLAERFEARPGTSGSWRRRVIVHQADQTSRFDRDNPGLERDVPVSRKGTFGTHLCRDREHHLWLSRCQRKPSEEQRSRSSMDQCFDSFWVS